MLITFSMFKLSLLTCPCRDGGALVGLNMSRGSSLKAGGIKKPYLQRLPGLQVGCGRMRFSFRSNVTQRGCWGQGVQRGLLVVDVVLRLGERESPGPRA